MRAKIIAALVLSLFGAATARADSELQKFQATLPPRGVDLEFVLFRACALITKSEKRGASFAAIEAAIANACDKHWEKLSRDLAPHMGPEQRFMTVEKLKKLALAERRLRFAGKPIPGYRMDPETARMVKCTDPAAKDAVRACFVREAAPLASSSREPPETIAVAVEGLCLPAKSRLVLQLAGCMDIGQAQSIVRGYLETLRTEVVGKVVRARAGR